MTAKIREAIIYLDDFIENPDKPVIKPQIMTVITVEEW